MSDADDLDPGIRLFAQRLAAGYAAHPSLDGVDLAPAFADAAWRRPGDLCWRMKHREQRALVRGDWKYLQVDGAEFLFDLGTDVRERANLALRQPERRANMNPERVKASAVPEQAAGNAG